jgi:hypothetical protein
MQSEKPFNKMASEENLTYFLGLFIASLLENKALVY